MTKHKDFIPTGTGPKGARFGRDTATGLAFKADGTTRKARVTLTPAQRMAALAKMAASAMASIGRSVLKAVPRFSTLRDNVATFRKWVRDVKGYSTPEAVAERRGYYQRMLDAIDAKAKVAGPWLAKAGAAVAKVNDLHAAIGRKVTTFSEENGRDPTPEEVETMVADAIDPASLAIIEGAADPANDPFATFRRDAADPDTGDGETLDDEDGADDDADDDAQ